MLQQPLLDRLSALRLPGLRQGLEEQAVSAHYAELPFEERLSLLVDREWQRRENARLARGLRAAHLQQTAYIEDLDLSPARGLDRRSVLSLVQCDWIQRSLNLLILGPTGPGRPTSPAPWARPPAVRGSACGICGPHDCSMR